MLHMCRILWYRSISTGDADLNKGNLRQDCERLNCGDAGIYKGSLSQRCGRLQNSDAGLNKGSLSQHCERQSDFVKKFALV